MFSTDFLEKDLSQQKKIYFYVEGQALTLSNKKTLTKSTRNRWEPNPNLFNVHQKLTQIFNLLKTPSDAKYPALISEIGNERRWSQLKTNLKIINAAFEKTKPGIISRILLAIVNFYNLLTKKPRIAPNVCQPFKWDEIAIDFKAPPLAIPPHPSKPEGELQCVEKYSTKKIKPIDQSIFNEIVNFAQNECKDNGIFEYNVGNHPRAYILKNDTRLSIFILRDQIEGNHYFIESYDTSGKLVATHMATVTTTPHEKKRAEKEKDVSSKFLQKKGELFHINILKQLESIYLSLLPKGSLNELKDQLNCNQKIKYALDIATGIKSFHDKGYMHRKIDLENIYILAKNEVVLGGFENAVLESEFDDVIIGENLAPESTGEPKLQTRAGDIYAFGKVLNGLFENEKGNFVNKVQDIAKKMLSDNPQERPSIDEIILHLKQGE